MPTASWRTSWCPLSSVATITTHADDATSRLIEQNKGRPNKVAFVGALGSVVQQFEDLAYPVLNGRFLVNASGRQLDGIGELVGQVRDNQDDATYRLFLAGRIYANNSDASAETLLALVRNLFAAPTATIISPYSAGHAHWHAPAVLGIEVGSPALAPVLYPSAIRVLQDSIAAAVRLSFVTVFDVDDTFALSGPNPGAGLDGGNDALGLATIIYADAGA